MDYERVARELLRHLRGRRSQVAWSRRLGYRSNVAYAWESGRRWPTAAETLRACTRTGIDLNASFERFYGKPPTWVGTVDPTQPEAVALLLNDLRGNATVTDLAQRAERSRYRVTRWLSGQTQPRLPDFLRLIEAASVRLVDFIAALVEPTAIPSIAGLWRRIEARRLGASRHPWSQAVLRCLELQDYQALPAHDPQWIAHRLRRPVDEVESCIELLAESGAIRRVGPHLRPRAIAVDTRLRPEVGRQLKAHWTRVAAERIEANEHGQYSYNVFTVSRADFEAIRALHLAYFHNLRQVVAASKTDEVVAVANVQLFPLSENA